MLGRLVISVAILMGVPSWSNDEATPEERVHTYRALQQLIEELTHDPLLAEIEREFRRQMVEIRRGKSHSLARFNHLSMGFAPRYRERVRGMPERIARDFPGFVAQVKSTSNGPAYVWQMDELDTLLDPVGRMNEVVRDPFRKKYRTVGKSALTILRPLELHFWGNILNDGCGAYFLMLTPYLN